PPAVRQAANRLTAGRPASGHPAAKATAPAGRRGNPLLQRTASRGGARIARAEPPRSWQAGLPEASGEQRECPAGTMSTLARGHDDVVRCLPL
ncbi:hypothetical protein NON00_23645, partial [Roseomonas sp. GC11]|nr:hypothetical protein [Roseomonas sp. GC11]